MVGSLHWQVQLHEREDLPPQVSRLSWIQDIDENTAKTEINSKRGSMTADLMSEERLLLGSWGTGILHRLPGSGYTQQAPLLRRQSDQVSA